MLINPYVGQRIRYIKDGNFKNEVARITAVYSSNIYVVFDNVKYRGYEFSSTFHEYEPLTFSSPEEEAQYAVQVKQEQERRAQEEKREAALYLKRFEQQQRLRHAMKFL